MTDKSATERLREMLDERGVAHSDHYLSTTWRDGHGILHLAGEPMADGSLVVDMLTPEQAIAATLGSGALTADDVLNAVYKHGARWQAIADELNSRAERTCKMETDHDELEVIAYSHEDTWAYKCSACDWSFRYDRGIKPNYCPNCGRKCI